MSSLTSIADDLRRFKASSSVSPEDMAHLLLTQFRLGLDSDAFDDSASLEKKPARGRRGRRKQTSEISLEEQSAPEKSATRQKGTHKSATSEPQSEKLNEGAE